MKSWLNGSARDLNLKGSKGRGALRGGRRDDVRGIDLKYAALREVGGAREGAVRTVVGEGGEGGVGSDGLLKA